MPSYVLLITVRDTSRPLPWPHAKDFVTKNNTVFYERALLCCDIPKIMK